MIELTHPVTTQPSTSSRRKKRARGTGGFGGVGVSGRWMNDAVKPLCCFNWIWMGCHCVNKYCREKRLTAHMCVHMYTNTHTHTQSQTWQFLLGTETKGRQFQKIHPCYNTAFTMQIREDYFLFWKKAYKVVIKQHRLHSDCNDP